MVKQLPCLACCSCQRHLKGKSQTECTKYHEQGSGALMLVSCLCICSGSQFSGSGCHGKWVCVLPGPCFVHTVSFQPSATLSGVRVRLLHTSGEGASAAGTAAEQAGSPGRQGRSQGRGTGGQQRTSAAGISADGLDDSGNGEPPEFPEATDVVILGEQYQDGHVTEGVCVSVCE